LCDENIDPKNYLSYENDSITINIKHIKSKLQASAFFVACCTLPEKESRGEKKFPKAYAAYLLVKIE
jgi:hypothetical protein